MKRNLLHFVVSIVTFVLGVSLASAWLYDLFTFNIEVQQPPQIESKSPKLSSKLTFDCTNPMGIVDEFSSDGAGGTDCTCSDGSRIWIGEYNDTWTKKKANRTFQRVIKKSKVISISAILDTQGNNIGKRAVIEKDGNVRILRLEKIDAEYYFKPFKVTEIQAPDLEHALAFEVK